MTELDKKIRQSFVKEVDDYFRTQDMPCEQVSDNQLTVLAIYDEGEPLIEITFKVSRGKEEMEQWLNGRMD